MPLISFDIDGTLETGDPKGSVTMDMIQILKNKGNILGSCSDRPVSYQNNMWEKQGLQVDFTVLKNRLKDVMTTFESDSYLHIGDTDMDEYFAQKAGFQFLRVDSIEFLDWKESIFCSR